MDLFGWDTVFVGAIETINQALTRAEDGLIQTFSFTEDGISASGTFGAWSIVPGGSGQLLDLCLPIASGQFTPAPGRGIDLAGINVVLRVPLRWLGAQATDTTDLTFDLREVARKDSQDPAKISVVSVSPTNRLTPIQRSAVGHAIAQYISAHAAQVSFVFVSVDPGKLGTAAWLRPVVSEYVYVAPAGGATPMLAILSSVTARDVSSLPRNVDAELLPGAGANAGFGIAGPLVLRNMIGPALASGLGANPNGIRPGQNGGMTLAGPINLPPLPGSGKTPTLSNVTATLKDTRVTIEYAGGMELAPGIRMTFNVDCDLEAAVATPEGPRPLGLRDDDPELRRKIGPARLIFQTVSRNHRHDVQEEWWFTAARKLAGGSFSWLTDQFFDQAINQTVEILVNVIDAGLARWAPSVIDLAPVLWSGQSKFSPASGQLAGGLVLRGTLA